MQRLCRPALTFIKGALIVLNGTLHVADQEIPGSIAALQRLRDAGVLCRFVTNSTKDTRTNLLALVNQLGFNIKEEEVFSSLAAAKKLVEDEQLRPSLLLHPRALPDFAGLSTEKPNAVVVGLAKEAFSYENMNRALRILLCNSGSRLIAVHKGRLMKEPDGLSLGPGPFVLALDDASGKTAEVVGKPEASFYTMALQDLGCCPEETVMVGDDVRDDIGGAQRVGMRGVLVKTGKYRAGDEYTIDVAPDAVLNNFSSAVDWILKCRGLNSS